MLVSHNELTSTQVDAWPWGILCLEIKTYKHIEVINTYTDE